MTPLCIEAVYERVHPQGAATRFGVRARFERAAVDEGGAPAGRDEDAAAALGPSAEQARRSLVVHAGGERRRGPREAAPEPFPELLGYGPGGWAIPLWSEGAYARGAGRTLDLYA